MDGRTLVARNLRKLRVERGLSQDALAVDAGLDRSYVGRIERGLENPTVDTLDRFAKALGVAAAEFLLVPEKDEGPLPTLRRGRRAR
jgi:transcriptional regulator with XRE-family HTH domain